MDYVEVHPANGGFQLRVELDGAVEEPFITGEEFIGPALGILGVRVTGLWEEVEDDAGQKFRRAQIIR